MTKSVEGFDVRLRQAIRAKGMTCHQVSVLTKINWNSMNGYLNEQRIPNCLNLVKLAKVLGVTTDWLLGLEGE